MSKRKSRFTTTADYVECLGLFARLTLPRRVDILTRVWQRDPYSFDAVEIATMVTRRNTKMLVPDKKSQAAGERIAEDSCKEFCYCGGQCSRLSDHPELCSCSVCKAQWMRGCEEAIKREAAS